ANSWRKLMRRSWMVVALPWLAGAAAGQGEPAGAPVPALSREHSPTSILYRLRHSSPAAIHEELADAVGGDLAQAPWPGFIHRIVLRGDADLASALDRLNHDPRL